MGISRLHRAHRSESISLTCGTGIYRFVLSYQMEGEKVARATYLIRSVASAKESNCSKTKRLYHPQVSIVKF